MDPLSTTECVAKLREFRNQLLLEFDGRVVLAAFLAESGGLGAALRVGNIYNVEALLLLFSRHLAQAATIVPGEVHVIHQDDIKPPEKGSTN